MGALGHGARFRSSAASPRPVTAFNDVVTLLPNMTFWVWLAFLVGAATAFVGWLEVWRKWELARTLGMRGTGALQDVTRRRKYDRHWDWRPSLARLLQDPKEEKRFFANVDKHNSGISRSHRNEYVEMRKDGVAARLHCRLLMGIFSRRKTLLPRDVGYMMVRIAYAMRYEQSWMRKQGSARHRAEEEGRERPDDIIVTHTHYEYDDENGHATATTWINVVRTFNAQGEEIEWVQGIGWRIKPDSN